MLRKGSVSLPVYGKRTNHMSNGPTSLAILFVVVYAMKKEIGVQTGYIDVSAARGHVPRRNASDKLVSLINVEDEDADAAMLT
jgi:hypothetical protein